LGTLDANELTRQIPVGLDLFVYLSRQPVKVRIERAHHNAGMLHQTVPRQPQEVKPVLRQKAPMLSCREPQYFFVWNGTVCVASLQ
jgi:hypothetical protein